MRVSCLERLGVQSSLSQKPSGTLHEVLEGEMGCGGGCAWQQVAMHLWCNQWRVKRGVRVRNDSVACSSGELPGGSAQQARTAKR